MTLSQTQASVGVLADNDPTETVVVSLQPPPRPSHDDGGSGRISQTTEHLLIAAGSIGRLHRKHGVCSVLINARRDNHRCDGRVSHLHNA